MKNIFKTTSIVLILGFATLAHAEEKNETKGQVYLNEHGNTEEKNKTKRQVYLNEHNIVLEEDGKITKFITPKDLTDHGRFQIRIKKPEPEIPVVKEEEIPQEPTLKDRIEARRIMHLANQSYFKGNLTKTWELVAQAEKLDPSFFRIKTMKGSLLYKIGSKDLAVEVWMKSLAQNPDQPEIIQVIEKIKGKPLDRSSIAHGQSEAAGKKATM